ncbi:MAG: class I SAM-dependent methyltransferase [Clostridia bacterium]|nr:class I SAM-dependent methyltransferase [Clostridia bacterium]
MERIEAVVNYYSSHNEDGRLRAKHGLVEFLTTVHYVERYLKSGMKILEIGAGTGRYSHYFAQKGYEVDAVELVEHNIEVFRANTEEGERVTITQGDALDLAHIPDESYDITLLLGPMYHLYTEPEQKQALAETIRVTKTGGIVFAAYCNSDMTMLQYCFMRGMIHQSLAQNKIDTKTYKLYSLPEDVFQLYRKEDVDALMQGFPTTRLHYVGTDMLTRMMNECLDAMDDETFAVYMHYTLSICERPDLIGATNHMLDIFRKEYDDE